MKFPHDSLLNDGSNENAKVFRGEHLPPEKKTHFEVSRCSGDPKRMRRIKLPEYVDSDDEDLDLPGAVPHNRRGGDDKTKNEKL